MPLQSISYYDSKIADVIFNDAPISIFILDNSGLIKKANKNALLLLESTIENLYLKPIFDFIPKIDLVFPKVWWQKFYYKNNEELISQIIKKNGEIVTLKITVQLNLDVNKHIIYASVVNNFVPKISDDLEPVDKLAAYFKCSSDLITILDADAKILSFNNTFEHYAKVVFDLKVMEGDDILDYIESENRNDFLENFNKALNGNELTFEKEVFYTGLSIWWHITFMPIRNPQGGIQAVAFVLKNIDDRKVAEAALKKSEERFKLVVAGLNEGWWDWDLQSNFLFYSPQWWKNIGYENNELVNLPSYWEKIVHPDDIERVQNTFQEALLSNKNTYEIEYRAKHKDGFFIPMFSRGYLLRDKNGKAIRVSGSDMDLTIQKQTENLLLENQRKLQIAQKLACLGNYEIDCINFNFTGSQMTYDILGIDEGFVKSVENFNELIHPEDKDKVQYFYNRLTEQDPIYTCEFRIINYKTGEIRWISDFSNIEFNQKGVATKVIGAIQDITSRKIIENEIQKNEIKYRSLIENMDLGILEVDNNEIITKAYPKFCELVGYSESELLGKSAVELFLPKTDISKFEQAVAGRSKGTSNAYEIKILNKSGEVIDVIISGTPLFDESGKVVGSIGIHYNISEPKKTTYELKKSFDLVNQQNKRLLNFSYIVSHNLRSHASNITSLLNLLKITDNENDKKEIHNHLNAVSELLNETLSNLNEVVSIQNNIDVIVEPINILGQIEKVLILLNNQIELKKVQINVDIEQFITVNFNPAYFESILYNLISNAIKYSKPNEQSIIKIGSKTINDKLVLSISDNGIGIDLAKNGNKLFGMYKTFNGNEDARGIGLFITKDQIESMGGKIEVESTLGVGTTFSVFFN